MSRYDDLPPIEGPTIQMYVDEDGNWHPPSVTDCIKKEREKEMSRKIVNARKTMRESFKKDPDFRFGYQSNIAMYMWDRKREGCTFSKEKCNEVADGLIKLLWEND